MRDDTQKWDSVSDCTEVLVSENLTIMHVQPERQTMISGVSALDQTELALIEWPGNISGEQYALVLRRDRILEINGAKLTTGWNEENTCAVSDMSDGYAVLHISGSAALPLLRRGGFVNPEERSRSVARILFGMPVLLYRHEPSDQFRLHVGAGLLQALKSIIVSCHAHS